MQAPLVTEQSVHAAADALKKEGKTVTYKAIRDRIGGGSYRDIKIHWASWWAKQAKTSSAAASAATTAAEAEKYLREATIKIEAAFQRRLGDEVGRMREESENGSRVGAAQLDAASEDICALEDEVDGLKTQLADAQAKFEAERQHAQSLTSALNEERVQRSILAAVESTTQQRVNDLKEARAVLLSEIAAEREMNASLRDRERHLRDELEQARSAANDSQQQVAHLLAESNASSRRLHEIEAGYKTELETGTRKLQEAQVALTEARERAARLQGELEGIRNRRDELPASAQPDLPLPPKGKAVLAGAKATAT